MGFIQGEGRTQGILFPVVLDDLVPGGHMCRVIDAFVGRLEISQLGFERDDPVLHFYQTSMATFVLEMSGPAPIEDRTGLRENTNLTSRVWEPTVFSPPIGTWLRLALSSSRRRFPR